MPVVSSRASTLADVTTGLQRSQTLRLFALGGLTVVLMLPIVMIGLLVGERQDRRDDAIADVGGRWGGGQTVTGPALVVPVVRRVTDTPSASSSTKPTEHTEAREAVFLPGRLHMRGALATETLSRGIFTVPVYRMSLTLDGDFGSVKRADLDIGDADVRWDQARLVLGLSEVRAIQDQVTVTWNGRPVSFQPGGMFSNLGGGISAPVPIAAAPASNTFSVPLTIKGSVSAYFVPFGADTAVELTSNFPHPNFQGAWLPTSRSVSAEGFRASWSVPYLGRGYPQAWLASSGSEPGDTIRKSRFGVELQDPVDPYRMAFRSVKYAGLFILLTFGTVWLIEVLSGVRVHPVQYLLLGAALCLFYLLELSLSEHIHFAAAYGLAATAVIAMVGGYSLVVFKRASRALGVGVGVVVLYGYLYVLLTNEDYALLIGSVGLFLVLALVMIATRRVDWYAPGVKASDAP